jgi:hypothetical protein
MSQRENAHALILSKAASDEDKFIEERLEMNDNITD